MLGGAPAWAEQRLPGIDALRQAAPASSVVSDALPAAAAARGPLSAAAVEQELLPVAKAFPATAIPIDAQTVAVRFELPQGYYLYREKLRFSFGPEAEPPLAIGLPPGTVIDDEFFGRVETFRGVVEARLTMQEPRGGQRIALVVDSQGCADLGVCYPPYRQRFSVLFPADGADRQQAR